MSASLPTRARKAIPAAVLLATSAIVTGCGPDHGYRLLPYSHTSSLGNSGQLVSSPPTDLRHHGRGPRPVQFHRHSPPL
ncbi:hypothetical protein [Granulicella sp. dw_53]|uniref:hypothetical protein n=1 Tax=Granulicella sp. dw_53 TaxID=2719792 RepID=UPI001BD65893|nr:hypothetical protein [Granulicella sp. dw_53]